MTTYLHEEEKKELYKFAYSMHTSFDNLMRLVNLIPKEKFDCVEKFKTAESEMTKIYRQICDREDYKWDLDAYRTCNNALQAAMTTVNNEATALNKEGYKYDEILKRAQTCHGWQYRYHEAWIAINKFTKDNTFASASRAAGKHAFSQKKIHMDELLHELKILGSSSWETEV
jgi:hypothetical protein